MSVSVQDQAREVILAAALGDPVADVPAPILAEAVHLVTNPDLLLWDALWRNPEACQLAVLTLPLSGDQINAVVKIAWKRADRSSLVRAVGTASLERDRISQSLVLTHVTTGGHANSFLKSLLDDPALRKGSLTHRAALSAWYLYNLGRGLVLSGTAILAALPLPALEVVHVLALGHDSAPGSEISAVSNFIAHVEMSLAVEGVSAPPMVGGLLLSLSLAAQAGSPRIWVA